MPDKQMNVIVLNYDHTFLGFTSWKAAMRKLTKGTCVSIVDSEAVVNDMIYKPHVIKRLKKERRFYGNQIKFSKKNVHIRDSHTCQYCGDKPKKLTIDHVIPKGQGGKNTFENTVSACQPCNNRKACRTPSEARMYLKGKQPVRPTVMEFMMIKAKQGGAYDQLEQYFKSLK